MLDGRRHWGRQEREAGGAGLETSTDARHGVHGGYRSENLNVAQRQGTRCRVGGPELLDGNEPSNSAAIDGRPGPRQRPGKHVACRVGPQHSRRAGCVGGSRHHLHRPRCQPRWPIVIVPRPKGDARDLIDPPKVDSDPWERLVQACEEPGGARSGGGNDAGCCG